MNIINLNLKKYDFFNKILIITATITAILLLTLAFLVTFSVISRYCFHKPIGWVIEISEYILLWSTFIGITWVLKEDDHIKIDLLINYLSNNYKQWIGLITYFIGFFLFLSVTLYSSLEIFDIYSRGILYVKMLKIPKYLLLICIPFGTLLLTIQYFKMIILGIGSRKINSLSNII